MTNCAMRLFFVAGLLAMSAGCVVLPVPNCRLEGYGVASRVVDADTGRPISGARVADVRDERRAVMTNEDGRFRLEPYVQWHFGYLWGVTSYPIWPFTGDIVDPDRSVRIHAAGYDDSVFTLSSIHATQGRENVRSGIPVQDDVLLPPSLPIRSRPTTRPAERSRENPGPAGG